MIAIPLAKVATMIVSSVAGGHTPTATATAVHPMTSVDVSSVGIGLAIFAILAVMVARVSYARRKEEAMRVKEWLALENARKQRYRDVTLEKPAV
jgi:hypothetical protein